MKQKRTSEKENVDRLRRARNEWRDYYDEL